MFSESQQTTYKPVLQQILSVRLRWRVIIILCSLVATIFGLLAPLFQKEFVDHILGITNPNLHFLPLNHPITFLLFSFLCMILSISLSQLTNYIGMRESVMMQSYFSDKIYSHTMSLRSDTLHTRQVGEIVAMYTTDISASTFILEQTIPMGSSTVFPLIFTPYLISTLYDTPMFLTYMVILAVVLLNFFMAYRQSKFFYKFKQLATQRIGLVNEWVQNIKTLRLLGWVSQFEEKIFKVRRIETQNRVTMVTNGQLMNAVASTLTFALNVLAIFTFISIHGNQFSPGKLLALLWIIAILLTRPFRQMPWFFTFAFDAWTSMKRLDQYFTTQNIPAKSWKNKDDHHAPQLNSIEVKNLNLQINKKPLLKNINFNINANEFVAIVGEVGSGKSLLLLSLLGETRAEFETYQIGNMNVLNLSQDEVKKFFTFVGQDGFIMSSSLRDNIGLQYDMSQNHDDHILQSLKLAQLDIKKESIVNDLELLIGERGVNLSGGQKQRISIARAHYLAANIIILDDSLSAVDVDTENKLIQDLFYNEWKSKTRILSTHRLSVLDKVDKIIFLEKGEISGIGTFSELNKNNVGFQNFTKSLIKKEEELKKEESQTTQNNLAGDKAYEGIGPK